MIHKRRGSKYYSYKFMYGGELYSESTNQSNAKVAKEIEVAKRAELAKGEVGIFERKSIANLKEFCDRWFSPRISGTLTGFIKQKTWDDFYKTGINALLAFEPFASTRLDDIDTELIGLFATYRHGQGEKGKSALYENLDKRAFYAAFWKATNSVLVAAKRCAFSSR